MYLKLNEINSILFEKHEKGAIAPYDIETVDQKVASLKAFEGCFQ